MSIWTSRAETARMDEIRRQAEEAERALRDQRRRAEPIIGRAREIRRENHLAARLRAAFQLREEESA